MRLYTKESSHALLNNYIILSVRRSERREARIIIRNTHNNVILNGSPCRQTQWYGRLLFISRILYIRAQTKSYLNRQAGNFRGALANFQGPGGWGVDRSVDENRPTIRIPTTGRLIMNDCSHIRLWVLRNKNCYKISFFY